MAFTKRTIIQLKNSGGLRLIRSRSASDSIIHYDQTCERIESQMDIGIVGIINDHVNPAALRLFDMQYIIKAKGLNSLRMDKKPLKLLNNDEKLVREYANWVYYARSYIRRYVMLLEDHQSRSLRLIQLLKKEYHLE